MDAGARMRFWIAALLACVAAGPASVAAGTVSKCLGPGGQIVFTSAECPEGTRPAATYDATPEPRARAPRASSQVRGTTTRTPRRRAAAARGGRARASSQDRCRAARAQRDATLDRVGLERTFDLLRKLDEDVREACRRPAR